MKQILLIALIILITSCGLSQENSSGKSLGERSLLEEVDDSSGISGEQQQLYALLKSYHQLQRDARDTRARDAAQEKIQKQLQL